MIGTGIIAVNKHDHQPPRAYDLEGEDRHVITWMHNFKIVEDATNEKERDIIWFEISEKTSLRKWY